MTTVQVFRSTVVVLLTLLCGYILIVSGHIMLVLLIAIIIASALRPIVDALTRLHVPEGIAISFVYLGLAIIIVLVFVAVFPPIINQVAQYLENDNRLAFRIIQAQRWVEHLMSDMTSSQVSLVAPEEIRTAVSNFVIQMRNVMPSMLDDIGSTLGEAVLIFVMGAYWLTSHNKTIDYITRLSPPFYRDKAKAVIDEVENTVGGYVRGVFVISSLVGLLNFAVLQLLGVPNAFTLAFLIALATTIPMIGGLIGGILATLITLVTVPQYVLTVFLTFFVIQQIENYFLTPRIMANSVGLDPLLVIIYTSVGFVILGVVGALVAIPVMGTIHILLTNFVIEPYRENIQTFKTENGVPIIQLSDAHGGNNGNGGNGNPAKVSVQPGQS